MSTLSECGGDWKERVALKRRALGTCLDSHNLKADLAIVIHIIEWTSRHCFRSLSTVY